MAKLTRLTLLIVLALLSFGLRVWGIGFGLPFEYHPDEQQYILPGLGIVSGNFEPLAYFNPTLYPYLIGLVYTLLYHGLRLFGTFPEFFDLNAPWKEAMLSWTAGMIFVARYTSVAAGVATTLMVYQVGRRAYGYVTGLGAGIIFGLTFLPVREAHFAVSDAPVALAITIVLYLSLNIVKRGSWQDYLWVGVMFGLATATKYSAGLLILTVIVAHLVSERYDSWSQRWRSAWLVLLSGLVGLASYVLVSPYTILRWEEFVADFGENLQSGREGFSGFDLDPAGGTIFYLKGLIWGMGWPIFLLFLVAALYMLWRRRRVDLVLFILPLTVFLYMQRQEMYFVRWLMPLVPPMCILASETVRSFVKWFRKQAQHSPGWSAAQVSLSLIFLLTLPSTVMAVKADYVFSQLDTRTEALNWIRANIPPTSHLAVRILNPPWAPPLNLPGLEIGPYTFAPVPDRGVTEVDIQQFREWQVEYVIATSFYYAQPLLNKDHQAKLEARLRTLDQQAELIALFQPYGREYNGFFYHDQVFGPANDVLYRQQPGPIIRIYRLP